jgi:hypothetical protein
MEPVRNRTVALASTVALCLASFCTQAADIDKKGHFTGTHTWYAVGKAAEIEKNHWFWTGEFSGVFVNDAGSGFMHLASVACPGMNDIAADGTNFAHGYCTVTDGSGDAAYLAWKCKGRAGDQCVGDFHWTGGTGKYTGIKGNNKFIGHGIASTNSGYSFWTDANWELP